MLTFRKVSLNDGVQGSLYLHSMPGRHEDLGDVWKHLKTLGVGTIVCLAPLDEVRDKSPKYAAAIEKDEVPCTIRRFPVCDGKLCAAADAEPLGRHSYRESQA